MKIILSLTLAMLSLAAQAQEPLGRLFTTPTDRATLNHIRQTKKEIVPQVIQESLPMAEQTPQELPDAVALQGYVKRTDGKKSTVWVNNQAIQEDTVNQEIAVGKLSSRGNRVPIKLKANGKVLALKAGQSYSPETNKVNEARSAVHGESADATQFGTIDNTP